MHLRLVLSALGLALGVVVKAQKDQIVVGYYPSWKKAKIDGMDLSKYTHINLAFGIPEASGTFTFEGQSFVSSVVTDLHAAGVKVLMSVGGWTGSNLISTILKDKTTRKAFMDSMVSYVKDNKLDGIDIDWEYPGRLGNTCNVFDATNDTPNFLAFLQDLRAAFDTEFAEEKKLITMAVRVEPFDVDDGPSKDVSDFAKVVDFANLMQYDINGGWADTTGPNAPFNFEEGKGLQASFVSAIDAWTEAGWPASQLTAGFGFYGRSTTATQDMTKDPKNQYQPQIKDKVPLGDSDDAPWADKCAGTTSNSGMWKWANLRSQGVLTSPTKAAAPWVRQWDEVSKTPWLFNPTTKQFISYDDPQSIKVKIDYAASKGLAGAMVWSIEMDYKGELLSAVKKWNGSGAPADDGDDPVKKPANPPKKPTDGGNPDDEEEEESSSEKEDESNPDEDNPGDNVPLNNSEFVVPVSGAACATNGMLECADDTGTDTTYMFCVNDKWLPMECGAGTACIRTGGSITCGWPKTT
ncbi:hypothetical protein GGI20_002030 [Coemansia sp. BCRC 34301]|nr:hypothetical protein GGI20_002030 [Coemansia sp. BCRC 34301]